MNRLLVAWALVLALTQGCAQLPIVEGVGTSQISSEVPPPYASSAPSPTEMLSEIPCDRVRHNSDGSWTIPGTIYLGPVVMRDITFNRGAEAAILDFRCGSH